MDRGRRALSELRVHAELLRAQVEMGFSLVHLAETAIEAGEDANFRAVVGEAHHAVCECKRLLNSAEQAALQDYMLEVQLLEFELHDLEAGHPVIGAGSSDPV